MERTIPLPDIRLDIGDQRLWRGEHVVPITNKAFQLLRLFVERPERLVSKEEILDTLWGEVFVTEGLVREYVHDLRVALNDDAKRPRFIETVPRHGYRFLGGIQLEQSRSTPHRPTVVVRSFTDLSGSERGVRLAAGLTDDLLTDLVRFPDIAVLLKDDSETRSSYRLEGTVQISEGRIRVNVRLSRMNDGGHVWAEKFDRTEGDFLAIQSDISTRVAVAIGSGSGPLSLAELTRLKRERTSELKAWELTRLAFDLETGFQRENTLDALQLIEKALRIDPEYAQAWLVLGWICWQIGMEGWCDDAEAFRARSLDAYIRAAGLNPKHAVAQMELSAAKAVLGEEAASRAAIERALDLGADQPDIMISCANYVASLFDETERAAEIIKDSFEILHNISGFHRLTELRVALFSGEYQRAIDVASFAPDLIQTRLFLALALAGLGKDSEEAVSAVRARNPEFDALKYLDDHPIKGKQVTARFIRLADRAKLLEREILQ